STMPDASAPRIRGFGTDGRPLRTHTSRWFSDAERTRTRAVPGPGSGTGTSSRDRTSGPPSSWIRTARTTRHPTGAPVAEEGHTVESGLSYAALEPQSGERFHTLRRELGVTTFGLNQILLQPRQRGRIHRPPA